jgi:hypothetical protein
MGLKLDFPHDGRMLRLNGAQHRRDVATPADLPWPDEMDGNTAIGKPTSRPTRGAPPKAWRTN